MQRLLLLPALILPAFIHAQCYPDRHNTSWNEAWISCEVRESPNPDRGSGHWILYDFGNTYRLGNLKLWNVNAPEYLEAGFKDFYIDCSQDGMEWNFLGQFTLSQASGKSIYEGEDVTTFGGDTARFVLFTAIDTWGDNCAGIAEAKFDVIEVISELQVYDAEECFDVSVYPNPHNEDFTFSLKTNCNGTIDYGLYDHTGKQVLKGSFNGDDPLKIERINTGDLPSGLYHLILHQNRQVARYPVMKI
jgi:hypothetical protein